MLTIGYESLDISTFIDVLCDHGVEVLIDVRELPLSRKPGFSKTALKRALKQAGIQYIHERELGAPKPLRHRLRKTGDWETYQIAFNAYLETKKEALSRVADIAASHRVALMCFEKEPSKCHRSLIAERLLDLGWVDRVRHLTPSQTGAVSHVASAK